MITTSEISIAIKNEALRMGFTACGFSRAEELSEDAERLKNWLDLKYNGSMQYMENHFEKRCDPRKLVQGAKSVVSLLINYNTKEKQIDPEAPIISKYAYGKDYHFVIKDKMKVLFDFIDTNFGPVSGRFFVDSAPVLDRAWANKAGLGWIGKNSNLINRKYGSFIFIAELIIDLELDYNEIPEGDFCGDCALCIESCPTGAILSNRSIDSNKCISYLTIENRSEIPEEFKGQFENRVFGCDICQDVCPWNRKSIQHQIEEFDPDPRLLEMKKNDWDNISEKDFSELARGSAIKRAGFNGMKRNIDFLS